LRPGQWIALAIAWCWAAALPVAAATVSAYDSTSATSSGTATPGHEPVVTVTHSTSTLLDENGWTVILITAVPLVVALAVTVALRRRDRRRRGAGSVAWLFTALLAAGNLLALLSIGVFVLPVTACLVVACILHNSEPGARRGPEPAMLGR
jgi:hypothetical protein